MKISKHIHFVLLLNIFQYSSIVATENTSLSELEKCLQIKQREININKEFVVAATDPQYETIRTSWSELGEASVSQINGAQLCPQRNITIAGVELKAHDISNRDYRFLIHTTAITLEKAKQLQHYILSQRKYGQSRLATQNLNFDTCPLISTSVIDPYTGGYTSNMDNAGLDLQIHLILKADPRVINHMGPRDIFSPDKTSINKYLNNIERRSSMASYFKDSLRSIRSPQQLIIETHTSRESVSNFCTSPFNEVVVCGNNVTRFFPDSQDIEILGIGISSYWIKERLNPHKEDIEALKSLGKIVPLVYYEPYTTSHMYSNIMFGHLLSNAWLREMQERYLDDKASVISELSPLPTFISRKPYLERLYEAVRDHATDADRDQSFLLPLALSRADIETVDKILDRNPTLNLNVKFKIQNFYTKDENLTSLIDLIPYSTKEGGDMVRFLLEKGLPLDESILFWGVKGKNVSFINFLVSFLKKDSFLLKNILLATNPQGMYALSASIQALSPNLEVFEALLAAYSIDATTLREALSAQNLLVHQCITSQNSTILKAVLLAFKEHKDLLKDALTQKEERFEQTPLDRTIELWKENNNSSVLDTLLETYAHNFELLMTLNDTGERGYNYFHQGAKLGDLMLINKLLAAYQNYPLLLKKAIFSKNKDFQTPLQIAKSHQNIDIESALLKSYSLDIETCKNLLNVDEKQNTPLHLALNSGDFDSVKKDFEVYQQYPELLESVLLQRNVKGYTPLHEASISGNYKIFHTFFAAYQQYPDLLNIILKDDLGNRKETFFHLAAWGQEASIMNILLSLYKSNQTYLREILNSEDQNYDTPFSITASTEIDLETLLGNLST